MIYTNKGMQYKNCEIREKITVKEKHVAVTGWFKICVLKYSNIHSRIHHYILERFRKYDANSKTTWMSSFGANCRQLLVCHVVLDDFTTRKYNFMPSLERHRFMLLLKKYESMHDKNHPLLFPMYCLMILIKGFTLTRLFFFCISLNFEHVNFWQILSIAITNQQNCKDC
jgi:hypothetical protein